MLAGIFWLGRRDWRNLGRLVAWTAGLGLVQLVLDPSDTLAFLGLANLEQVGAVRNFSPYALSPVLWSGLVALGLAATLRPARTRWGWGAAVALSVLATPRLLTYLLMTLLACLRPRDEPARDAASGSHAPPGPSGGRHPGSPG